MLGERAAPMKQKPVSCRGRRDDQHTDEDSALASIASKDGGGPVKEAEHQEQSKHQAEPISFSCNHQWPHAREV